MTVDPISLVSTLAAARNVDTMYRDLYLGRARTLLSPVISLEDFHRSEQQRAILAELPVEVARAIQQGNWPLVKELSQRTDALKQVVADEAKRVEAAHDVYAVTDVKLDPFCEVHPDTGEGLARSPRPNRRAAHDARADGRAMEGFLCGATCRLPDARPHWLRGGAEGRHQDGRQHLGRNHSGEAAAEALKAGDIMVSAIVSIVAAEKENKLWHE